MAKALQLRGYRHDQHPDHGLQPPDLPCAEVGLQDDGTAKPGVKDGLLCLKRSSACGHGGMLCKIPDEKMHNSRLLKFT
ncbi:hypothetical protein [Paenibacillus lacisoli]|uniref:hypothetical protein n=1 Tax=Paenibacillus lacisoli TaxID=3064525 RepID=UPI00272D74E1|nr:hypothetical protein [Paenibacillus sp. JX-17]